MHFITMNSRLFKAFFYCGTRSIYAQPVLGTVFELPSFGGIPTA